MNWSIGSIMMMTIVTLFFHHDTLWPFYIGISSILVLHLLDMRIVERTHSSSPRQRSPSSSKGRVINRVLSYVRPSQLPQDGIAYSHLEPEVRDAIRGGMEYQIHFDYLTSSPLFLKTAYAGDIITFAHVAVEEAFNGVCTLSVGDASDQQRFVTHYDIDLSKREEYQFFPNFKYSSDTELYVYIACSGATQGQGFVVLD